MLRTGNQGTKFIFVTGGVTSSIGKGSTASSLGHLLKLRGLRVAMQKFDAYFNINTGLMSPLQHGEVYVTADGGECDLDIGTYERFIDVNLTRDSDITSGRIYKAIIDRERSGDYNGGTVQVIPHVTDEIKKALYRCARSTEADILITEIGGTVGDIETLPFLEACRQMRQEVGANNCMYIHVTLVPYLEAAGELKTKPTQHSVKQLRSIGIQPDAVVCRSEYPIDKAMKEKIGLFCNLNASQVIGNYDVEPIYELPRMLYEEGLDELACKKFGISPETPMEDPWRQPLAEYKRSDKLLNVALVGKYVDLHDAYLSVFEALTHAGIEKRCRVEIKWVYSGDILTMEDAQRLLADVDAIVVPGGFGERGMEGMGRAARYARQEDIPFLGLGMGMQMAVVDYARDCCGLTEADSTEANPATGEPLVSMMAESKPDGTMRLGAQEVVFQPGSRIQEFYGGAESVLERHRNRYELNPDYEDILQDNGMVIGARTKGLDFAASVELPAGTHPYFIGVLYHAEFSTRLERPHPLFRGLLEAALKERA